jgi:hypothetical protein
MAVEATAAVEAEASTVVEVPVLAGFTAADLTVADPTAVVAAVEAATPDEARVASADAGDMAAQEGPPWAGPLAHRAPGTPIVTAAPAILPRAFIPLHPAATRAWALARDRPVPRDQATRPSLPIVLRLPTGNGIPSEVNTRRPEPHMEQSPAGRERPRLLPSVTLLAYIPLPLPVKPGSAVATASAAAIGVADGDGAAGGDGDLVGDGGGDSAGVRSGPARLIGITRGGGTITIRLTFTPIHNPMTRGS